MRKLYTFLKTKTILLWRYMRKLNKLNSCSQEKQKGDSMAFFNLWLLMNSVELRKMLFSVVFVFNYCFVLFLNITENGEMSLNEGFQTESKTTIQVKVLIRELQTITTRAVQRRGNLADKNITTLLAETQYLHLLTCIPGRHFLVIVH